MTGAAGRFAAIMFELGELLVAAERELPAPALARTRQIVGVVLEAHKTALSELMSALGETAGTHAALQRIVREEPVHGLLALHGLHPDPVQARVRRAVDAANVTAGKHGTVELVAETDVSVTVRVRGSNAAATEQLARLVQTTLDAQAPEVDVSIERDQLRSNLVPLERLSSRGGRP